MSETTPLLSESQGQARPHEHPIFLRVVHSPWTFVDQPFLLFFRVVMVAYMMVVFGFCLDAEINDDYGHKGLFPFYMGYLSYLFQLIYFALTALWTFQHYVSPRNRPQRDSWNLVDRTMSFISIPRTTQFTSANRYFFTIFYAAAMTFPFVVTFLHWFPLQQLGELGSARFPTGDSKTDWLIASLFIVNSVAAFWEMAFLSSVRKIYPFVDISLALVAITGLYFPWARLGHSITGEWTYPQVDSDVLTSQEMFVNVMISMTLASSMFLVVMAVHEMRDLQAKKAECDRSL